MTKCDLIISKVKNKNINIFTEICIIKMVNLDTK